VAAGGIRVLAAVAAADGRGRCVTIAGADVGEAVHIVGDAHIDGGVGPGRHVDGFEVSRAGVVPYDIDAAGQGWRQFAVPPPAQGDVRGELTPDADTRAIVAGSVGHAALGEL